jgi:hypothetical protein
VLQLALREGERGPKEERPETQFERERQAEFHAANVRTATAVAGVAAAGLLVWRLLRKRSERV